MKGLFLMAIGQVSIHVLRLAFFHSEQTQRESNIIYITFLKFSWVTAFSSMYFSLRKFSFMYKGNFQDRNTLS